MQTVTEQEQSAAGQTIEQAAVETTQLEPSIQLPQPGEKPKKGEKKKKQKDVSHFTRKKSWKKRIAFIVVFVVIAGAVAYNSLKPKDLSISVSTSPVTKGDLANVISLTGTVESSNKTLVYAPSTQEISSVDVEVGDTVEAGAILAQLDTTDIKLTIAQQQAQINETLKKNAFTIESAEKALTNESIDTAAGLNSTLISAQSALDSAQQELNASRHDYTEAKDDRELGDYEMDVSRRDFDRKTDALNKARSDLERAELAGEDTTALEQAFSEAEEAYLTAAEKYNALYQQYGDELSVEGKRLRNARVSYQHALDSYNATRNSVKRQIEGLRDNITSAELGNDMTSEYLSIQKLQNDLASATVLAPVSGTVTAVYAQQGATATGLMFVIEDVDQLIVKTSVKEYDIGTVQEGMKATIKSDATGETEFEGEVQMIYPTALKTATGETKTDGKVEFETDVKLTGKQEGLRVGMTVRLGVTAAEEKNVLSVPYDALATDAEGHTIFYTIETNAEGKSFAKAIPVTVGLETDFSAEVSGEGISEGMSVITDPSMVTDGAEVKDLTALMSGAAAGGAGVAVAVAAG